MVVTMIARTILRSIPKSRPEERAKNSAPVFAALDDQTRLRLVVRLCEGGPMSIPCLTSALPAVPTSRGWESPNIEGC